MIKMRNPILWVVMGLAPANLCWAQDSQYIPPAQEIGDVNFRTLDTAPFPSFDFHNSMLVNFAGTDRNDYALYNVIELLGSPGDSFACEPPSGVAENTLACFTAIGTLGSTDYEGPYTVPYALPQNADRLNILATADELSDAFQAGDITYINGSALTFSNYLFADIVYNQDQEALPGILDIGSITQMRSDAFTEFSYASAGFPIVCGGGPCAAGGLNLTIINDTSYFTEGALLLQITPQTQLLAMEPSVVIPPTMVVLDQNNNRINPGQTSATKSISISVGAALSGPGSLAIYDGDPSAGGQLLALQGTPWPSPGHVYTSTDTAGGLNMQLLGAIPQGTYFVLATDQAGNQVTQTFNIDDTPPAINVYEKTLQGNFVPDGGTTAATTLVVDANAPLVNGFTPGIASIEIFGRRHPSFHANADWCSRAVCFSIALC